MSNLKILLFGFIIGAGMSIPGISGGTLAIILGIYTLLLNKVNALFKEPKKSIPFLLLFCAGGAIGLLTAARIIGYILTTPAEVPLRFAFLGAAAGCIPPILKEAEFTPVTPKKVMQLVLGIAGAALISTIPAGLFAFGGTSLTDILMQTVGGVLVAVALVLPGISASQMLYMLGLYEPMIEAIGKFDIPALIPVGLGLLGGTLLTAAVISKLLKSTKATYLVILGFMIFSLKELLPVWSTVTELILGLICAAVGFIIAFLLTRKEAKSHKTHDIVS